MKISIESTPEIVQINGCPCRAWKGETDEGVEVVAFIHRIVPERGREAAFERELLEYPPAPETRVHEVLRHHLPVVHRTP